MEECGGTCVRSMLKDVLTDRFFGRADPFTTGIPALHSTVVIAALSPAPNNPPPRAAGRNAAAAATMSHYQPVNSLSDSLTAPFIFFPFLVLSS